jgi:ABC-type sugar transport system substrate-binding protein
VVGGDGERGAMERIRAGTQHATLFHDPLELAHETLRAAVGLAQKALDPLTLPRRSVAVSPPSRPMPALDVPFQLVTRETAVQSATTTPSPTGARKRVNPRPAVPLG